MLQIGDTYSDFVVFRQKDVKTFARLTGDYNPIHFENQENIFNTLTRPVVHGMYAASAFSGVLGTVFPGKGSIALYRELTFIRPVFVGESYAMIFKIVEIDYSKSLGVIKSTLKNEKGQICIQGVSKIKNVFAFSQQQ
jgi:acyl dehydratase